MNSVRKLLDTLPVRKVLPLPALALASVMAKDGSIVYASSDVLYKGAVFGRDSLEVAEDLMDIKPALVRNILLTLSRLQGVEYSTANEEEPGKIIHEYRTIVVDGKPITGQPLAIFRDLTQKWGGDDHTLAYYASVDATPQFLRTLHTYCQRHGKGILDVYVQQRNGSVITVRDAAAAATLWLEQRLAISQSGLLEYRRVNPRSFLNHVWKDSNEFYVHENQELANHDAPISSIEVQGLVYDALQAAMYFFPADRERYYHMASRLRDRTIELLWEPSRRYFALGVDFTAKGHARAIETPTSNPAELLDSALFNDIPIGKRKLYISAIVRRIVAHDFLTNAGIRSRSLNAAHLVTFWDYHGSYVTWPKDTYDIAKGLRRQGFPRLAEQLENRLLNLILKVRDYPEFVYVDGHGRVLPGRPKTGNTPKLVNVAGHNQPERIQAWTVSAIMAILAGRGLGGSKKATPQESWQITLESEILTQIPRMRTLINPLRLWLDYPTHDYRLTQASSTQV